MYSGVVGVHYPRLSRMAPTDTVHKTVATCDLRQVHRT